MQKQVIIVDSCLEALEVVVSVSSGVGKCERRDKIEERRFAEKRRPRCGKNSEKREFRFACAIFLGAGFSRSHSRNALDE